MDSIGLCESSEEHCAEQPAQEDQTHENQPLQQKKLPTDVIDDADAQDVDPFVSPPILPAAAPDTVDAAEGTGSRSAGFASPGEETPSNQQLDNISLELLILPTDDKVKINLSVHGVAVGADGGDGKVMPIPADPLREIAALLSGENEAVPMETDHIENVALSLAVGGVLEAATASPQAPVGNDTIETQAEASTPVAAAQAVQGVVQEIVQGVVQGGEGGTASVVPSAVPTPVPSNAGAMLEHLRSMIPPELTLKYAAPYEPTAEEVAAANDRVEEYKEEHERLKKSRGAKLDMKAVKAMEAKHPDWPGWEKRHGHPPGVELGRVCSGRAELWLLGAHGAYFRGISCAGTEPAYAIVLSGGYEDDDDHGDWLYYTGEGGRAEGSLQQAKAQEFTGGNLALQRNMEQGVPVRVMRGQRDKETGELSYTYDGLYYVAAAERIPGKAGALVCRFTLVGIPGHYKASRKLTFLALQRGFRSVQLAGAHRPAPRRKAAPAFGGTKKRRSGKKRTADGTSVPEGPLAEPLATGPHDKEALLEEIRQRPGLVCEDLSGGKEAWPIPVFNETGDGEIPPTDLEYVVKSIPATPAAQEMAAAALAVTPNGGRWCGVSRRGGTAAYNEEGQLLATDAQGIWECCSEECRGYNCASNQVVSAGLDLPLEVFKTVGRGWGVRCAVPIDPGTFVASYEGDIITNEEAEARRQHDSYLFDLDHFQIFYADPSTTLAEREALPNLPAIATVPAVPSQGSQAAAATAASELHAPHLVIDAHHRGSVARFFNHSCSPNMLVQPVLTKGCSGLCYRVMLVALEHVKAGDELTYNYGARYFFKAGDETIPCGCGAPNCRGVLGQ